MLKCVSVTLSVNRQESADVYYPAAVHTNGGTNPKGLQLWIDLPAEAKMMDPQYQEHSSKELVSLEFTARKRLPEYLRLTASPSFVRHLG